MCMRRRINHRDDNTTSHCEGYHSAIKGHIRSRGSENLRLDKLVHFLLTVVSEMYTYRNQVAFDSASRHPALKSVLLDSSVLCGLALLAVFEMACLERTSQSKQPAVA